MLCEKHREDEHLIRAVFLGGIQVGLLIARAKGTKMEEERIHSTRQTERTDCRVLRDSDLLKTGCK